VRQQFGFLRNIEDIFGDMSGEILTRSFPAFSNRHYFIEQIILSVFHEDFDDVENSMIVKFIRHIGMEEHLSDVASEDDLIVIQDEDWYSSAFENLVDEVFHVLFLNIEFLQAFNEMTSGYAQNYLSSFSGENGNPILRRVNVPQFVKDGIYFRDGGECRTCKKDLSRTVTPFIKERFDHIVPLAKGGCNDITNIQLLCHECNSLKSDKLLVVSQQERRPY
jgi:hypothetical protein